MTKCGRIPREPGRQGEPVRTLTAIPPALCFFRRPQRHANSARRLVAVLFIIDSDFN